ncbi:hypothetical protein [Urechidicola croceus]|uniref:hypothetical protein n=1 Tax=Urechidicola croceus TaxID=1850246 RepID=UPI0012EA974D|nr:hypothetical protein [Urechidicola croceus]
MHYKKQKVEFFLEELNELHEKYISRTFDFDKNFISHLKECQDFFHEIGDSNMSSKLSQLRTYFETSLKGINPQNLEKIRTGKRENIWISAFHCLSNHGNQLQESLNNLEFILNEANETLSQLVITAFQSKLINDKDLKTIKNLNDIENKWNQLCQNEQIKLIEKKLKLTIHQQDIYILLDKIFNKIKL